MKCEMILKCINEVRTVRQHRAAFHPPELPIAELSEVLSGLQSLQSRRN